MKRIILTAIALSLAIPQSVQAQGCDEKSNFMVMPNGKCIVLDYLNILATGRTVGDRTNANFQKQFDANLELDTNSYNRQTETKEARDRRIADLAIASKSRIKINATVQEIEDTLYPVHLNALGRVKEGFRR